MYIKNVFFIFLRLKVVGVGLNLRFCIRFINDLRLNVMLG